jgi:hypothetical protein
MPLKKGKDSEGCCVKWGDAGAHYYYSCESQQEYEAAKIKALKQGAAIGDYFKNKK